MKIRVLLVCLGVSALLLSIGIPAVLAIAGIERVSVAADGAQGNDVSFISSISADGRYIAFASAASNLVQGDANGVPDVFVRDRQTDTTTRVSLAADGTQGNDDAIYTSISADGRYVAFESTASNLVPGDTNSVEDVFVATLAQPNPAISSINPNQGTWGQTLDNVVITGANFTGATSVSFGDGITINSFNVISATQIRMSITISPVATAGLRGISLTTSAGSGSLNNGFMVIATSVTRHSSSTISTPQGPVSLPSVSVQSASLSVAKIAPGTPVTVTANVANTGAINGTSRITLYVNGQEESSQGITINSGSNTPVTFSVRRNEPGTYSVYVGGTNAGSFTVDALADPNIILYISGALILFAFAIGVIYTTRKRQQGR
jgi:hypothetical protein